MTRLRPRHLVITGLVGLLVVAGVGAALLVIPHRDAHPARRTSAAPTTTVTRGLLEKAQSVTGRVGYGGAVTISARGSGIITWLPRVGATVARGGQLYRVDDRPVSLFLGELPLYRTLRDPAAAKASAGDEPHRPKKKTPPPPPPTGNDVDLVATNLADLGFYHGTTSGASYGWYLAHAVAEWQESLGEEATGVISPDDVAVNRGPVRVASVDAHLGEPAAEPVLSVTATRKVITLQVPKTVATGLHHGQRITVTLGSGARLRTRVQSIGQPSTDTNDDGSSDTPTAPVVVTAIRPKKVDRAPLGPVTARIVTASRKHALRVPVTALLALAGGGYALERPDHSLVPVTLGMVSDGAVQVHGIEAGAKVLVAR